MEKLRRAVEGLEYPSESDAPFEVFGWGAGGRESAREQVAAHAKAGAKIQEVAVDGFFKELEESEDAERFGELRRTLESVLRDVRVFRVGAGRAKVEIYLIGRTRGGAWAGVRTVSVET